MTNYHLIAKDREYFFVDTSRRDACIYWKSSDEDFIISKMFYTKWLGNWVPNLRILNRAGVSGTILLYDKIILHLSKDRFCWVCFRRFNELDEKMGLNSNLERIGLDKFSLSMAICDNCLSKFYTNYYC